MCTKCPEQHTTVALYAAITFVAVCIFTYLVWDNLDGAKEMVPPTATGTPPQVIISSSMSAAAKMPFHSIAIRIVSSYLQIAGLLTRFDLTLPKAVHALAIAEASSSSLSEQLLLFDCGTDVRSDRDIFLLRQMASVWIIPLVSILCCAVFWFCMFPALHHRSKARSPTALRRMRPKDGFISSMLVLFYTLFPSVVNRIALTFSCKTYGDRNLLTEALSVQCLDSAHWSMIVLIGIPGMVLFVFIVPGLIAKKLITQRRKGHLYPTQAKYEPRWTLRLGFMFAGYRQGYEWWEAVVMLRKCAFVLLSIFLRTYGASPQVVAASMVLIVATSAHLQHRPYQDPAHNWLESVGLHVCLLQLLVALISNMIGRVNRNESESPLGLQSTVVVILIVFASTGYFFWETLVSTVQNSQDMDGAVGTIARCCGRKMPCLCGRRTRRDSSTASGVAAAASAPRSSSARRLSLNAGLGRRALLRKVKSRKARQLVSSAEQHRISLHERVSSNQGDAKRRLMKRLKLRKQPVSS